LDDDTLALLVADDPRRQARRLLQHVATRAKAKAVAIVNVDGDELASFVGEVPLSRLTALQLVWKAEAKALRAGTPAVGDDYSVLPLMDGLGLIGILFVEGGSGVEMRSASVVALSAALKAARERPVGEDREESVSVPGGEVERHRLLASLERYEWNVSRVARLIGVTRRTVYLRMERYKIDRRRVPKTLKPTPLLEEDA
jgi:transcriptional regulator of acetoin/glycerol metabolism